MRRHCLYLSILFLTGCAAPTQVPTSVVDSDADGHLSIRKIDIPSDIAVIRSDYQIVVGNAGRVMSVDRTARWVRSSQPAGQIAESSEEKPESTRVVTQTQTPKSLDRTLYLNETHFEFGSSKLTAAAKEVLEKTASELDKLAPRKLSIIGHADSVGGDAANQKLSERRADAVFAFLRAKGVKVDNVDRVGFGESAPIADNSTAAGRAKNRRAEIVATVKKKEE